MQRPKHDQTRDGTASKRLMSTGKVDAYDGLRGVLSLVVVAGHAWQTIVSSQGHSLSWAQHLFGLSARMAVLAFFCLSGYLIAMSVAENRRRHAAAFDSGEYVEARIFRIVPPLLLVIALTVAMELALVTMGSSTSSQPAAARQSFATSAAEQIAALATLSIFGSLTGNWLNGPLWSLVYEIQLYVIVGLLGVICFGARQLHRVAALIALAFYLDAIGMPGQTFPYTLQCLAFSCFGLGVAAFAARHQMRTWMSWSVVAACSVAAGFTWFNLAPADGLDKLDTSRQWLFVQVLVAGACAFSLPLLVGVQWLKRISVTGAFSYTLYIAHFPLLLAIYMLLFNNARWSLTGPVAWMTAAVAGIAVIVACMWIGRWVEQPAAQRRWFRAMWRQRLARRGRG